MFSFGVTDLQAPKKAPTPPSSIALDDDAQKRNTDCIYFLASPLTCKKGNKCEYRHSEAARTNPRDCRFWKSGNCMNAYCSFRHLPLEGKPSAAPVTSTPMAHTKVPPVPAMSTAAGFGPSKSKTPCYFFAQGCCAKNDQCPFMHGLPAVSSTAEAAPQQSHAGGDGKALHASGRPLILLKQSGLLSQEVRPITNGRSEALNETHTTTSRAAGLPEQGVPYGSERAALPERIANPHNESNGSMYGQNNKKMLQNQGYFQGHESKNQNSYQTKALWKVGPSGDGSCQSFGRQEDYSSPSDSQESLKGPSSPPACNGQDSNEGDLRAHLAKRMKSNSRLNSSRGNRVLPDLAPQRPRGRTPSDHYLTQRKQEQGETIRKVGVEADVGGVKGAQVNKRQSAEAPKTGQSRSFAVKQGTMHQLKVHNVEAAAKPENGVHLASSDLRSKRLISGSVKETLSFTGPKSLAQIKAEKMAGGNAGFKAIGRLDSRSTVAEANSRLDSCNIIAEANSKLSGRTLPVPAGIRNASAANEKAISSHTKFVSTTKQDDVSKHEVVTTEEFEGPKPLSTLLKRKREAESGSIIKESMPGPSKAQVSEPKSLGEMEDGEFRSDDDSSNVDDTDAPVSSQEDVGGMSAAMEEVMGGLQGSSGEAAECGTESSDDGSKADLDMEEALYGGEDYEMDGYDDDDDDEDDFAKKLGRVFGLSYA